jgi:hypothetical protein
MLITLGCSKSPVLPLQLAHQVANADRVVLTDSNGLAPTRLEFRDAEAQNLVRAISVSSRMNMPRNSAPSCPGGMSLAFYSGTNFLAQVAGHDDHIHTPEGFYHDGSGALQKAWQAVYDH